MSQKRGRKRKRRSRERARQAPLFATPGEHALRLAQRLAAGLGAALILVALVLPYLAPHWNRAMGARGNVALRVAGFALVIVAIMFGRSHK